MIEFSIRNTFDIKLTFREFELFWRYNHLNNPYKTLYMKKPILTPQKSDATIETSFCKTVSL